jgi:hypothetical protein
LKVIQGSAIGAAQIDYRLESKIKVKIKIEWLLTRTGCHDWIAEY